MLSFESSTILIISILKLIYYFFRPKSKHNCPSWLIELNSKCICNWKLILSPISRVGVHADRRNGVYINMLSVYISWTITCLRTFLSKTCQVCQIQCECAVTFWIPCKEYVGLSCCKRVTFKIITRVHSCL